MDIKSEKVREAVEALKAWVKRKAGDGLMDDTPKVNLVLGFKNTPPHTTNATIKIALPHSPVQSGSDVCLFVKDVNSSKRDYTPSVDEFEALLSKHSVTSITKVIPLKSLKTEYKEHEAKRQLSNMFEVFLADARIIRLLPSYLGKNFYKRKRYPLQVDLTKQDVKQEITDALHRTQAVIRGRGPTCMTCIGHVGLPSDHVTENVMKAIERLASGVPGGKANVKTLHLKTPDSPALPIYLSLDSEGEIAFSPPPEEGEWEEVEELSAANKFIRVKPSTGEFQVLSKKKAKELVKKQAEVAAEKHVEKNELTLVVRSQMTPKGLKKFFKQATSVTMQSVKWDTGSKKRLAFVQMPTRDALHKYDAYVTGGKTLTVADKPVELDYYGVKNQFKSNRRKLNDRTLHVSGIKAGVTAKDLRAHFPAAVDIRLPVTRYGKQAGYALVEFGNAAEVASAFKAKRQVVIGGKKMQLDYMGARSLKRGSPGKAVEPEADENEAIDDKEASADEEEQPTTKRRRVGGESVAVTTPKSQGKQSSTPALTPAFPKATPKSKKNAKSAAKTPKSAQKSDTPKSMEKSSAVKKVLVAKNKKSPKRLKTA